MNPTVTPQRGNAIIIDNRDHTREKVRALGTTVPEANANAFLNADQYCQSRNSREGWTRFVPVR